MIAKNENFIGKGYLSDFNLNVMNTSLVKYEFLSFSIANTELSHMWHGRLGDVNLKTIKWIMNLDLIPKFKINAKIRCCIHDFYYHFKLCWYGAKGGRSEGETSEYKYERGNAKHSIIQGGWVIQY